MSDDPYEVPDAKIILPVPQSRNRRLVQVGLAIAGLIMLIVIVSNITIFSTKPAAAKPTQVVAKALPKPPEPTEEDKKRVMGQVGEDDPLAETKGVPAKTRAQDAAERGERVYRPQVSERQQRETASLDSSPIAVDFSDYYAKDAKPTEANTAPIPIPKVEAPAPVPQSVGKLFKLMEDTIIETVLVNRLAGASIGPVIVMVTTDVYSNSGQHLLIPSGTRILGTVSAVGGTNQERLFVAFHRMIMPDGYSVSLDKFQGMDVLGQTGLKDLVNHHYVQIFGTSVLLAAVGAASQIGSSTSSFGAYNWGVQLRSGVSQGMSESAQRVMERFLNVLPTFTIRERARVKTMLSADLELPDVQNHTIDPDF